MQNKTPLKTKAVTYCLIHGRKWCLTRKQYKAINRAGQVKAVNIGKQKFLNK